eukprot:TRINITY_DN12858_c0_g3_i2.p3 TRINITY_DN12858_c0_g3~~TRINITY_DN12858_c0_g3_i2.p3  ORF type:complete len:271 (+),score=73.32 TRINITY_DN12858_c0_g3_i2:319-1131(+)
MSGYCLNIPLLLPGPIDFTVTFCKGNLKLFEELYKETQGMISCQRTTQLNAQYQTDLSNSSYSVSDLMPRSKRDPFISVFVEQPGYYPWPCELCTLMDQTIAGITDFGKPIGFPHPDFAVPSQPVNSYGSVPPHMGFAQGGPGQMQMPVGVIQPSNLYPNSSIEAVAQAVPGEVRAEDVKVAYPSLANPEAFCNYCKKSGPEYTMMKLGCAHWMHNLCLVYYMQNTAKSGGTLKNILCTTCGHPIDYPILKTVGGELADQLYTRSIQDGY